ncbi:hypothetical protein PspLS_09806 [Pyricularia sp. CBS 133598]|nr:hypothetical protein PspLS_09806 [Pyricularia sp. CBS 133598]
MASHKFNPATDIPDLSDKVILVTGGNIGLGQESILQLAKHNPKRIFLAARNEQKARKAVEAISQKIGGEMSSVITFLPLDLSSFESVRKASDTVKSQTDELHILFNNAGIMMTPAATTINGYEEQFGVCHMGHALLTRLLLPLLERTAKNGEVDVRIVTLSSAGEMMANAGCFKDMSRYKTSMQDLQTVKRYGAAKLANIYHSQMLARKYPSIKAVSLHPGVVKTNLMQGMKDNWPILGSILVPIIGNVFCKSVADGARNQLWAAVSDKVVSGEFYHPVGVLGKGSPATKNAGDAEKLWEWTEKELNAYLNK